MREIQETRVQSLGWKIPLEKGMATHASNFAWKIPWTQKPGGLQFMASQRVGHDWTTKHAHTHTHTIIWATGQYHRPIFWNHHPRASRTELRQAVWLVHGDIMHLFQSWTWDLGVGAQSLRSGCPLAPRPWREPWCAETVLWADKKLTWLGLGSEGCVTESTMAMEVRLETRKYMSVWSDPLLGSHEKPIRFPESSGTAHCSCSRALWGSSSRTQSPLALEIILKVNNTSYHYLKKVCGSNILLRNILLFHKMGPHYKEFYS